MNIIGLDALIFGVDDIQACTHCLRDYGLLPVDVDSEGGRFEALDGTAVIIRRADDARLPAAIGPAPRFVKPFMAWPAQLILRPSPMNWGAIAR